MTTSTSDPSTNAKGETWLYTAEQIGNMRLNDFEKNHDGIMAALTAGRIKPSRSFGPRNSARASGRNR